MNIWHMRLEYSEMESEYHLLLAGCSDKYHKSFREAVRLPAMAEPEFLVQELRALADRIERRIE